jgi:hypothetical protein
MRVENAVYAQLWLMLYHAGQIESSPIEVRARMRAALAAEQCAGEDRSQLIFGPEVDIPGD